VCYCINCLQVTSATDKNVHSVMDAIFGSGGLTSCEDEVSYDATVARIRTTYLPNVPPRLRAYFDADVEPLLRQNMTVGCAGWTNNACESANHVLKQRTQWRINHLPELIEKCRALVDAQYKEADRALLALGDFHLQPAYARHRQTLARWQAMSERQRQRATTDCFRLQLPSDISSSTDGELTVNQKPGGGKKLNQRKRMRAERTT